MRINEVITEGIGDDLDLTARQYRSIIKDLKDKQVGDRRATAALNDIESRWAKGEKLLGNYKTIIKDFDLEL